jgi:hypothetical protein
MGGSSSKPAPVVQAPSFDYSKATVQLPDLEQYEDQVKATVDSLGAQLQSTLSSASAYQSMFWTVFYILIFVGVLYFCYYYVYPWILSHLPTSVKPPPPAGSGKDLSITSAMAGRRDVTRKVVDEVENNELHIQANESVDVKKGETLTVTYQYPGESPGSVSVAYGKTLDISPDAKSLKQSSASNPSSWWNNKNLLAAPKDAKETSSVSVPVNGDGGAYGYQFWMYVTDWNYKFGQEKHVMSREDLTNTAIMNPVITLHPTDNTMKISVSIFPSSGDSSKAEPAPAGHSGATDDVFVCEVPNIPLQTWLAVSVTVSTRNLDVYLNGKLVKSCFLTGVPKPVSGSVTLNKDGGFSGWMCSFYHYAKLLVPADAQTFYGSGVPCNVPGTSTNYKVTLGVHDTKGQVVSKYMF